MAARAPGKHAMIFVTITVLLDVIGFGLVIPVFPALLADLTGDTISQAAIHGGWLAVTYAVMQFFFAPILGNLSDRYGRRPVLLLSVGALGIDYIVTGFAPTLGWLFLGRAIAGVAGASFTSAYAYVADVLPPEKRAQGFGMVSAAFGLGFILGPAIGGFLGELGPRAPFFAAAGLSIANVVYGYFVLPESLPVEKRRAFEWKRANPVGTLIQMRKHPEVLALLGALFLWMVGHQVMPATWSFYTKYRFAWSEATIGASLAVVGTIMVISQAVVLRALVPRIGERRVALAGILVAAVGYFGYATATTSWVFFAWQLTWLFGAMVMPASNAVMSHRIDASSQGELQGALASLYSLSTIVGPPFMAQLFGRFSNPTATVVVPGAAFFAAGVLALTCFTIYWSVTRAP